ncbi:MAG: 2-oxoacid:acceptor oxidoreductase subunit alpha [Candidatus Heimdallarchaeota archaeon]|nr:2-oxoacid:acceptor oxidoreductase subunit alpha [Candidatus Heimdallarchaeota archaeon]MDH5645878.1 2-oxoacid:acceptor oxidoreductase subunit alpha [Candidatus Heimdallarchaeota archaeon]
MSENKLVEEPRVLAGPQFNSGNFAVAEAALFAGLHGYFGYPITPSTTIMERLASRLPYVEKPGAFLQAEDEIASITAVIGCSWTRNKAMTATSGPGFSLMQEGIGLATFTETPLVVVNVMRGGPSTGLPTFPAQQELMQAHFGSHGDYMVPTFAPNNVQECFDLTIEAFNASEALRTPVFVLTDQILSTLKERFLIPKKENIELVNRSSPDNPHITWKGETISSNLVLPMNCFGEESKAFATGLSHDDTGHVDLSADTYELLMNRLKEKILTYQHLFPKPEKYLIDDADTVVVAYGSTARSAKYAVNSARKKGIKAGLYRLRTIWPFPKDDIIQSLRGKRIIVVEMSSGQLIWPVERYLKQDVEHIGYLRGSVPPPSLIRKKIEGVN